MKNFFYLALVAFTLFTTGCGSDDDGPVGPAFCTDQAFSQAVSDAVMDLSAAAQAYANDQSTANCNAYKQAARDYLDEVKRFESCATIGQRQDFRDALQEAENNVNMTLC
ncbi:hypothetical protein [Neolewinella persica]|uniref:hypothetical protein n=1 Tax=Neolewinella persica TaxID=70998 RepID=UPI00036AC118|nr:hypothetical protein [Neolewinella persica]